LRQVYTIQLGNHTRATSFFFSYFINGIVVLFHHTHEKTDYKKQIMVRTPISEKKRHLNTEETR